MIYLDTHAVVWLFAGDSNLFSPMAIDAIESNDLLISPAVLLELQFLNEIDRISARPQQIREYLESQIGLRVCELPFVSVISQSISNNWTRDPFDRLIIGQAQARGDSKLLTKDRSIRQFYEGAIWD